MSYRLPAAATLLALLAPSAFAAEAQSASDDALQEVVVFGRGERLIGVAAAASEGTVGGADLAVRPLLRVAELLEAVPGLIAAQHSGSGKANQYFLRGFNLDHGTDFTTLVDGVPLNMRSHGHGQGYLDINGLIPEVIQRIDFRKGPYRADLGDFAIAGAAMMRTVDRLDRPFLAVEGGGFDWRRLAGGTQVDIGAGSLLMFGQWKSYDGPWQQPEDLKHFSAYSKYQRELSGGHVWVSLSDYIASWKPTEQIPERAIGTSICASRFCALDSTATGDTNRHILAAGYEGDRWRGNAYTQFYDWNMYSNSTYDYQIHQWDRRFVHGFRADTDVMKTGRLQWTAGVEGRFDQASKVQVDHTDQRQFLEYLGAHRIDEQSLAAYSELNFHATDRLRLFGGLRADAYWFSAEAIQPGFDSGDADDTLVSPKLGAAFKVTSEIEMYANWGKGFHSNDARGVAASDPPVPGLVEGTGQELGARFQRGPLSLTATYWWLEVDSELKFVGDSNSVEPGSGSKRHGYELVAFWRPMPWLAIDATWTESNARFLDSPGAEFIPGAVESAGELGIAAVRDGWELSARLRHLGKYPLVEDNSQRSDSEDILNLRASREFGSFTVYGELLNALNHRGQDIVYFYETFVPAIDAAPTEGRVSRADEPRTVRLGLKYQF